MVSGRGSPVTWGRRTNQWAETERIAFGLGRRPAQGVRSRGANGSSSMAIIGEPWPRRGRAGGPRRGWRWSWSSSRRSGPWSPPASARSGTAAARAAREPRNVRRVGRSISRSNRGGRTGAALAPARPWSGGRAYFLAGGASLSELGVDGDGHHVADDGVRAVAHAEVLAVDGGGGGEAAAGVALRVLDLGGRAGHVEHHRLGDAVHGQVAGHLELPRRPSRPWWT